jgi:hypothetical protein
MVNFMPQMLYPCEKSPQYTVDRRLGGSQSQSGCDGKGKIFLPCPCWELNSGHPAGSLVAILTDILALLNERCILI